MKLFDATTYQVRIAMTLKKDESVLSKPKRLARKGIDEDTINNVISFYLDDEFSREMPGAKEYVSIDYKQHKPKRLLLCNLTELCYFSGEISQFYNWIFKILCSSSKVVQSNWFF